MPTPKSRNTLGDLRDYTIQQFVVSPEEAFAVLPGFVAVWPEPTVASPVPADLPGVEGLWTSFGFAGIGREPPRKASAATWQPWDGVDFDQLHRAGVEWFGEVFDHFGGPEVLADQSRSGWRSPASARRSISTDPVA